jgi:hypothetical protein
LIESAKDKRKTYWDVKSSYEKERLRKLLYRSAIQGGSFSAEVML